MYAENGRHIYLNEFFDTAIYALEWIEDKTSVKYEMPHLQLLSHPGIKSGMENYGLIALHDYTNRDNFVYNCLIVMHEVSNLWWWNSVWLNEGFAQFIMYPIFCDFSAKYADKCHQLFIGYDGIDCLDFFDNEKNRS